MSFRLVATPLHAPMRRPAERQDAIASAVAAAIIPAAGTGPALERLRAPGALTVTTGQQPALFLGPLYTLHKALSAAALAAALEARWQRPVVPVFWLAGDDHDWEEARSAAWIGDRGGLETASLRHRPASAPMAPLARELLGPEVADALRRFSETTGQSATGRDVVELLARHFQPSATVSAAVGGAIAELLAPLGILVLDSTHPAFKQAAAPFLLEALAQSRRLNAALNTRHAELLTAGRDPGVAPDDAATLVMLDGEGGRDRLLLTDGGYRLRRARSPLSQSEIEGIAEREPMRLSANVLLRPVLESQLLASVAYCAGPGELRYLALARATFDVMGVPRPAPVPRWSGIIVDSYVDRVADRFGVSLAELTDPAINVLNRAVRDRLPEPVVDALRRLREVSDTTLGELARQAETLDPTLVRSAQGSARRVDFEAGKIERRFVRNLKRRHAIELSQLERARTAVLPGGKPQERVISLAGALAQHGRPLMASVLEAAADFYRTALEGSPAPA